jgi:hypothetical protein
MTMKAPGWPGPFRIRLPILLISNEIGLGETIKRLTSRLGVRACRPCERRAMALDRLLVLRSRRAMPPPKSGCWFAGTNCYGFIQTLKFCCNDGTEYTERWGWCIGLWFAPPCRFGPQ